MRHLLVLAVLLTLLASACAAQIVSPAPSLLNFQGRLTKPDGTPVPDTTCSLQFSLYSVATGGNALWEQTLPAVAVKNGAFAVLLNVSTGLRNGATADTLFHGNLWLEIKVGNHTILTPRQQLVSVAYALKANSVSDGAIGSRQIADNAITSAKIAEGTITGADIANATIPGNKLASGALNSLAWLLGGNSGTNPNTQFLGTTDNQTLNFRVNNRRAVSYTYGEVPTLGIDLASRSINVLGGSDINEIGTDVVGATVAGGGRDLLTGTDLPNRVSGHFGTVGGGFNNRAGQAGPIFAEAGATVGGGYSNTALGAGSVVSGGRENQALSQHTTVAGGKGNSVTKSGASIGGGEGNTASETYATIGGGYQNTATDSNATVGGGILNTASGYASIVPGGYLNAALEDYTFAAGRRAKANHHGAFVWADSTDADFSSALPDQFNVRATGGVRIFTNAALTTGATLNIGDSSWNVVSDKNAKTNFAPVDVVDVVEKLAALPLTTWNYKANRDIRHIGLMAQDFYTAFGGLGMDDKHISTVDADGVAFAAIQGLYRKMLSQQAQIEAKEKRLAVLEAESARLQAKSAEVDTLKAQMEALIQRLEQLEQSRK